MPASRIPCRVQSSLRNITVAVIAAVAVAVAIAVVVAAIGVVAAVADSGAVTTISTDNSRVLLLVKPSNHMPAVVTLATIFQSPLQNLQLAVFFAAISHVFSSQGQPFILAH